MVIRRFDLRAYRIPNTIMQINEARIPVVEHAINRRTRLLPLGDDNTYRANSESADVISKKAANA